MPHITLMVTLRNCNICISPMQSVTNTKAFLFRGWSEEFLLAGTDTHSSQSR